VERTRALLHLITLEPTEGREPLADFDAINSELSKYDARVAGRPQVVAMSKGDLPDVRAAWANARVKFAERGIDLRLVSAATGEGVRDVIAALWQTLQPRDG
jgi:GTPase